jgi:hypothetical protein
MGGGGGYEQWFLSLKQCQDLQNSITAKIYTQEVYYQINDTSLSSIIKE